MQCQVCDDRAADVQCTHPNCATHKLMCHQCSSVYHALAVKKKHDVVDVCNACRGAVGNVRCEPCDHMYCAVCFKVDHAEHDPAHADKAKHVEVIELLSTSEAEDTDEDEDEGPVTPKKPKTVRFAEPAQPAKPAKPTKPKRASDDARPSRRVPSHVARMVQDTILPPHNDAKVAGPRTDAAEAIRERTRKLFSLGLNAGALPAEAARAMKLAHDMCRTYNLEQADIMRDVRDVAVLGGVYDVRIVSGRPQRGAVKRRNMAVPEWMTALSSVCARLLKVRTCYITDLLEINVQFYGVKASAHACAAGFEAVFNAACVNAETLPAKPGVSWRSTKNDYKTGVWTGVRDQSDHQQRSSASDGAIIPYNERHDAVALAVAAKLLPDIMPGRMLPVRRPVMDHDAYKKGREYGRSSDLKRKRIEGDDK